jgi:hypothetical protein
MGPQVIDGSVHVQLATKRITVAEMNQLIDRALGEGQRDTVTVSWADGRRAHAHDEEDLAKVVDYP